MDISDIRHAIMVDDVIILMTSLVIIRQKNKNKYTAKCSNIAIRPPLPDTHYRELSPSCGITGSVRFSSLCTVCAAVA